MRPSDNTEIVQEAIQEDVADVAGTAPPSPSLGIAGDALRVLLETPLSENTRRAYQDDLRDLCRFLREPELTPAAVELLLEMDRSRLTVTLRGYITDLRRRGLSEKTIRRRISSVRALLNQARSLGANVPDAQIVAAATRTMPTVDYRDTSGPAISEITRLLDAIDQSTPKGLRDYAMLYVLFTNGLRRSELVGADIRDFDRRAGRLAILGKGRNQREWVQLLPEASAAITAYLATRTDLSLDAPLFHSFDRRATSETRITGRGFYDVIHTHGMAVLERSISPHKFRHSATTEALELTNGNIPVVQDFTRHSRPETVMLYRHAANSGQSEVTRLLGERLRAEREKEPEC